MTDEFPGNSHKERARTAPAARPKSEEPERNVQRITTGEVVRRKKPLGRRFREVFIKGDAKGVWGYVIVDVVIPAGKDMVADAGIQFIERLIFGDSRRRLPRPGGGSPSGWTPYNQYAQTRPAGGRWSGGGQQEQRRDISPRARETHNFGEIALESRGDAEAVIDQLMEFISQYDAATVADLYSLVGISSHYTDRKYGWKSLQGAHASRDRSGLYVLNLPRPEPLD